MFLSVALAYLCHNLFVLISKTGSVRLSYPDLAMPLYNQYFVKMAEGEALENAKISPSTLVISANGVIKIFVDAVSIALF